MKGKQATLFQLGCKAIGISPKDVQYKLSCVNSELRPHDKMQFLSIGIPCRDMNTKQDVIAYLCQLGLSIIPKIKESDFRNIDKSWNCFCRVLVKEVGIDKAYEALSNLLQMASNKRFFDMTLSIKLCKWKTTGKNLL